MHRDSKNTIFKREMSIIGEKGQKAAVEDSPTLCDQSAAADDHYPPESPNKVEPEEADLHMDDQAIHEVGHEVKEYVRRTSLRA